MDHQGDQSKWCNRVYSHAFALSFRHPNRGSRLVGEEPSPMARHFAVLAVQAEGQKLSHPPIDRADGDGLADPPKIPAGSRLVAVVNNGEWQSALDVTYPSVYQKVYRRYQERSWNTMEIFLIDERPGHQIEGGRPGMMKRGTAHDA